MRKALLIIILLLMTLSTGCTKTTSSSDLIYDSKRIDVVSVDKVTEELTAEGSEISDISKVREIVSLLKDIEVYELSIQEERKVFNKENWSERVSYMLTLVASEESNSSDPVAAFKGAVTILTDGNLMFSDIKTMGPFKDGKVERTISYLSTENQADKIAKILEVAGQK